MKLWLSLAALNGFLAVAAGAFGAHGLEGKVAEKDLAAFQTGATYHMYHALALLAVAWLASRADIAAVATAGWSFIAGMVLFSGSLYFLGVTGSRALVMVTPIGGLAFLVGWAALAWAALHKGISG